MQNPAAVDICDSAGIVSMTAPQCVLQCLHDLGQAETRICQFDNLIMYHGQLHYIFSGQGTGL